jgi:DNA-binding transcriptional LysR family regulator
MSDPLARLSMRQLRLVAAISESGQLSVAAGRLGITQPAASRTLSELERQVGAALFERRTRGMVATEAGRGFARRAVTVLRELDAGLAEVTQLGAGLAGRVAVGAVTGAAMGYVVPVLRAFRQEAPEVEIEIETGMSEDLISGLVAQRFDIVLARVPPTLDARLIQAVPASDETVAFLCRAAHPVLRRSRVGLADLAQYDWVMQARGAPIRVTVEEALRAEGAPMPRHVSATQSLLVTTALLRSTDMVAPVTQEVADLFLRRLEAGGLRRVPLDRVLTVPRYSVVTLREGEPGPAAQRMLRLLLQQVERSRSGEARETPDP